MSSVNKVILIGRVGKDPDVKAFSNGNEIANFTMATSERWRDKQTGEQKEKTEWHNVSCSGGVVNVVKNYVKKGSQLYVEGKLTTRKWQDSDGTDRYMTEVQVGGFSGGITLLGGKPEGQTEQQLKPQQQPDVNWGLGDEIPF